MQNLKAAVIILGLVAIIGAVVLNVVGELKGQFTSGTAEYNATQKGIEGISKLMNFLPLIGLVVAAGVIIAIVTRTIAQ